MLREDLVAAFEKLVRTWELPAGGYDHLWELCAPYWGIQEHKGDELIARLTLLQKERGALASECHAARLATSSAHPLTPARFSEQLELLRQMELAGFTPRRFHASDLAYPITYGSLRPVSTGREYTIPSAPDAEYIDGTVSDWIFHIARFVLVHDPPYDPAIGQLEAEARALAAELEGNGGERRVYGR